MFIRFGLTRRLDPLDRVRELGDASVPFEFDVHAMIPSENAPALEQALHKKFLRNQMNKANARKEFFRITLQEIRAHVEKLGANVTWTMTAACREFRETQALERTMATEAFDAKAWTEQQMHDYVATAEEPEVAL